MPTFTMRLPERDYEALQAMALLTGRPMSDLVRDAVTAAIIEFAASPELEQRYKNELLLRQRALQVLESKAQMRDPDVDRSSAGEGDALETGGEA